RAARRALNGIDERERAMALETLASTNGEEARAALIEALTHPVKTVRITAARLFPDRRDPRILRAAVEALGDVWDHRLAYPDDFRDIVHKAGTAAVPELIAVLDHAAHYDRNAA